MMLTQQINEWIEVYRLSYKTSEICDSLLDFNPKKHKMIIGDCYFENYIDINDLGVLEVIMNDADFRNSKVENLGNLRIIGGAAKFGFSRIKSLQKLRYVGRDCMFLNCPIADLGDLRLVGGHFNCRGTTELKSIGKLSRVGGYFYITDSNIKDLGKLSIVEGTIFANNFFTVNEIREHMEIMNSRSIIQKKLIGIYNGETLSYNDKQVRIIKKETTGGFIIRTKNNFITYSTDGTFYNLND